MSSKVEITEGKEEEEEETDVFEVEAVVGHRLKHGKNQYLLKWKTVDDELTWEYEEQLNCPLLLAKYLASVEAQKKERAKELEELRTGELLTVERVWAKKPKMIVSAFRNNGRLFYRLLFDKNQYYSVVGDILREIRPDLICRFLENHIQICENGIAAEV
jgi:hypothetical protein